MNWNLTLISISTILLVPMLLCGQVIESKNGKNLPTRGTLKVMVVFAERTGNCELGSTSNWPSGQIPSNTNQYFDSEPPNSWESINGKLTRLYYDASYGQYIVLADYLDHVVQVPCSFTNAENADQMVKSHILPLITAGTAQFQNGSAIEEFDQWGDLGNSNDGRVKDPMPNGKIDALLSSRHILIL